MLFTTTPYHKNIPRRLLKGPKVYFYDISDIQEESAQLENLLAKLDNEVHLIEVKTSDNKISTNFIF